MYVGIHPIPTRSDRPYKILGDNNVYAVSSQQAASGIEALLEAFCQYQFKLCKSKLGQPDQPDLSSIDYGSTTMTTLMKTQLHCEHHHPVEGDINRMNTNMVDRFTHLAALALTANTTNLPSALPKTVFHPCEDSDRSHFKKVFYTILSREYNINLRYLVGILGKMNCPGNLQLDQLNSRPESVCRKIEGIFDMLKQGVHSDWPALIESRLDSNHNTKTGGMFVSEFFFLWPFLCGTFVERTNKINIADMISEKSISCLQELAQDDDRLNDWYPVSNGSLTIRGRELS